ncbi:MAG TPA: hypothetical protein VF516_30595 [Kofleriaceae bacterium]
MAFEMPFLLALLCLLIGVGCFKGNIASQVVTFSSRVCELPIGGCAAPPDRGQRDIERRAGLRLMASLFPEHRVVSFRGCSFMARAFH